MVRRGLCCLLAWITVPCADIVQSQIAQTLKDSKALSRCLQFFLQMKAPFVAFICIAAPFHSGVELSRLRSTACDGMALAVPYHCDTFSSYSMLSVIIPHIKQDSSLAMAVFATLGFLFWVNTIR